MPIDVNDIPNEYINRIFAAVIENAVSMAIQGDVNSIEYLGSDDARYYYDVLDLDYNTVIAETIRRNLENRNSENRFKAWSQERKELKKAVYKQIRNERRQRLIAEQI